MVEPVRHRRTKGAATDMLEPKATASHLDSTQMRSAAMSVILPLSGEKRTWPIWADMPVSTLTIRPTLLARAPHHITGHAVRRNRFRSANASRCGHDAAQA